MYLTTHIRLHIEWFILRISAGIHYDIGSVAQTGNLTIMIVSAPLHIHVVFAQQSGEFIGLLQCVVGCMSL